MKKVYIYAYSENNFGDDLFILQLVNRYPDTQFIMIANRHYKSIFKSHSNVLIYDINSINVKILRRFKKYDSWKKKIVNSCDYAVYIGGSIFMEYENWKEQYLWYKELFDNSKLLFIGCNWGPYKSSVFYHNMRNVLSNMKDVCFRDKTSYELFADLKNIRYAPDILFGVDLPKIEKKKQVLISVINCSSKEEGGVRLEKYEDTYLKNIERITKHYIQKGYAIKFVSFCEKENDSITIKQIKAHISPKFEKQISELIYDGKNIEHILDEMSASRFIIGSRFHAVILGITANVPVVPFVYSDKTINILKDMDYQGYYVDIRKNEEIDVDKMSESLEVWKVPDIIPNWMKMSENHFAVLDMVLEKGKVRL